MLSAMLMWLSILAAVAAGALGIWASIFTKVRFDVLDHQGEDLARQSRRAGWGAVAAAMAILLQAADRLWS